MSPSRSVLVLKRGGRKAELKRAYAEGMTHHFRLSMCQSFHSVPAPRKSMRWSVELKNLSLHLEASDGPFSPHTSGWFLEDFHPPFSSFKDVYIPAPQCCAVPRGGQFSILHSKVVLCPVSHCCDYYLPAAVIQIWFIPRKTHVEAWFPVLQCGKMSGTRKWCPHEGINAYLAGLD